MSRDASTMKFFAQAFIVVTNIIVCIILTFQAFSSATESQRIFELYEYPPYLNKTLVSGFYVASALLAIVLTVFIIKKRIWALNAIVIFYFVRTLVGEGAVYFFLGLILIHVALYVPLRKLYR